MDLKSLLLTLYFTKTPSKIPYADLKLLPEDFRMVSTPGQKLVVVIVCQSGYFEFFADPTVSSRYGTPESFVHRVPNMFTNVLTHEKHLLPCQYNGTFFTLCRYIQLTTEGHRRSTS